ncbi:uncharacterized protein B0J16DRAFT_411449 [Fusarium flagelliforme]|uniref:uncharacterized protein n=1 Tax=Fusarium flagelliforme TaxID=2675880 RepID=UPI001E8D7BF0|nr:uncharacterized protein B0J16DRAFT_411449 [Fusarium flagelliforme]KAH7192777.1 hypothetical protein B0J16DRAFT_411449 [Fusarium flagelliforme]
MDAAVKIYNTSVIPPPDGIVSNFDRTLSSVQIATIAVFAVTYFLATLSLGIRYATSVLVVKEWELDVVLITLAWGTALGYFISVCLMMKYGWGSHAWDVTLAEMVHYNKYLSPTTLTYMWSPTLTKLSILSVLYRISPARRHQVAVYIIAACLLIYTITFTVLLSGPCNPRDVGSGVCLNNLAISQVVLNIATDLSIIILPLPTLYYLQIPFRQKLVVAAILSVGSAVLIASIVRAPYVQIFATNPDFTRKQAEAGIWSLVELNMGIVCNNLMRLKPFLNRYLPKFLSYLGLSSGKSKQKKSDSPKSISKGKWKRKSSQGYQLHSIGNGDSNERSRKKSDTEDDRLESLGRDTSHPNVSSERIWKD